MKKFTLFLVSALLLTTSVFSQLQKDSTKAKPPTTVEAKKDTVQVPVYILQGSDTAAVTVEVYAPDGIVKWFDGWVVRTGLKSDAFQGGWSNFTDVVYDIKYNKSTARLKDLKPRTTPEQLKKLQAEQKKREEEAKKQQTTRPPAK